MDYDFNFLWKKMKCKDYSIILFINGIKMIVNTKELKKTLDRFVIEDIKEFGKPAFMYNYHYELNRINAIDTTDMWNQEHASLIKQGCTPKQEKRKIKFGIKTWDCILWIFRPVDKDGNVDEKKLLEMLTIPQDPLAMSIGYMVSGFCYLQLIKML